MGEGAACPPAHARRAGTPLSARPGLSPVRFGLKECACGSITSKRAAEQSHWGGSSRTLSEVLLGHYSTASPPPGAGQRLCLMGRVADLQDGKFWKSASQQPEYTRRHGPAHSETVSVINMFLNHN